MFITISGISGAGKTTLINFTLNHYNNFEYPKCITTRKERQNDSKDRYIFATVEEFENYISERELLEYQCYRGNYYGTLRKCYDEINDRGNIAITDMGYNGIVCLKKNLDTVLNVLIDVDLDLVLDRMIKRGDSIESIKLRLKNISEEKEMLSKIADIVLPNNEDIKSMTLDFTKILRKERIIKWD